MAEVGSGMHLGVEMDEKGNVVAIVLGFTEKVQTVFLELEHAEDLVKEINKILAMPRQKNVMMKQ